MTTRSLLQDLQQSLLLRLASEMPKYGFSKKVIDQAFYRSVPFGRWIFHVSFIPHETDFDITADVAIRVDAVEDLVNADIKLLSSREKKETATIGAELGNIADGRQRRWTVASPGDVDAVAMAMLHEFEVFGMPYFERFSDLGVMLDVLAANDRSAWLHSPFHTHRCKRVVALAVVTGDIELARTLSGRCATFLKERNESDVSSFSQFVERVLPEE